MHLCLIRRLTEGIRPHQIRISYPLLFRYHQCSSPVGNCLRIRARLSSQTQGMDESAEDGLGIVLSRAI
jgi:hypothetical protein